MTALRAGEWEMILRPELGGAIGSLRRGGVDVLRPTPPGETSVLQTACFPLLPYANRIDRGRFVFQGRPVQIDPTPGFEPHALHGTGWRSPWTLRIDGDTAVMTYVHAAGDWPWSFKAEQRLTLSAAGLTATLTMTNADSVPMPAGLGLHPYFVRRPDTRLRFASAGVWISDASEIPVVQKAPEALFDWRNGPMVRDAPFIDNAYSGWDGVAAIQDSRLHLRLEASSNGTALQVFAPHGETFVCVEPVTHRPNGLNAPPEEATGVEVLAPGETIALTLSVTAHDDESHSAGRPP